MISSTTTVSEVPPDVPRRCCRHDLSRGPGISGDVMGRWWDVARLWHLDGSSDLMVDARPLDREPEGKDAWQLYQLSIERSQMPTDDMLTHDDTRTLMLRMRRSCAGRD